MPSNCSHFNVGGDASLTRPDDDSGSLATPMSPAKAKHKQPIRSGFPMETPAYLGSEGNYAGWPRLSRFGLYRGGVAGRGLLGGIVSRANLLCQGIQGGSKASQLPISAVSFPRQ